MLLLPNIDEKENSVSACCQQIVSSSLCEVKHFETFPLTEQTRQRYCKRQDSDLQSPPDGLICHCRREASVYM